MGTNDRSAAAATDSVGLLLAAVALGAGALWLLNERRRSGGAATLPSFGESMSSRRAGFVAKPSVGEVLTALLDEATGARGRPNSSDKVGDRFKTRGELQSLLEDVERRLNVNANARFINEAEYKERAAGNYNLLAEWFHARIQP